jgi:hypothetical protein
MIKGKPYLLLVFLIILSKSCTKDKEPNTSVNNKVTLGPTVQVSSITINSASTGGNVLTSGLDEVLERGVCWNTTGKPTLNDSKTLNGKGTGPFISNITGLLSGTSYSVRSYAKTEFETIYGSELRFTTLQLPILTTGAASNITGTSALVSANIMSNGGQTISERGFCFNTSPNPNITHGRAVVLGTFVGPFSSTITGLSPNTTYYVRAYATTSAGTGYGNEINFKTPVAPVLSTSAVTSIGLTTAITGGNITNDGGSPITARGVCYSTSPNPTISNPRTSDGAGTGVFNSSLSGLAQYTVYYLRAYATNAAGTAYGNELQFRTFAVPSVNTTSAQSVTSSTAVSGGNVTFDGGITVSSRGVCWSTSQGPTISNARTTDGAGVGSFTSSIGGLLPNTRYYYRAYATHSLGTGYGNEMSFLTTTNCASISTISVSSVTSNTAMSGGQITNDGGAPVTSRGVCWNLTGSPTVNDSRTQNGSGTGTFSSSLTGLLPNRTYYVRAYATNAGGTCYGTQVTFTTSAELASVNTSGISSISSNSAVGGGQVVSDGGVSVSSRGVCWNLTGNPTTSDSRTVDGNGVGTFTSNITGLQPNRTYYVRAYAINSVGNSYGTQTTFTTQSLSLSAPVLASPNTGVTIRCCGVTFTWNAVSNAASYEIQISRSSTFSGTIYSSALIDCGSSSNPVTTGVNSRQVTTRDYCMRMGSSGLNGTWYWRVRAINGTILSAWSASRSFTFQF